VEGQQISRETVADRFSFRREVCMITLAKRFKEESRIGGINEIVELMNVRSVVRNMRERTCSGRFMDPWNDSQETCLQLSARNLS